MGRPQPQQTAEEIAREEKRRMKAHRAREKKEHVENLKNVQLQEALQKALTHSASKSGAAASSTASGSKKLSVTETVAVEQDSYGRGAPTDRVQFGYTPANAEEAVLFHKQTSAKAWIAARKRNAQLVYGKKQKLRVGNCEPLTTVLKLKRYWSRLSAFSATLRQEGAAGLSTAAAEEFLEVLARKQKSGAADDDDAAVADDPVTRVKQGNHDHEAASKSAQLRRLEML